MPTPVLHIRLAPELVERLDAVAILLTKKARGVPVTRTDAIRIVVERGLDVLEEELKHPTPPPPVRRK